MPRLSHFLTFQVGPKLIHPSSQAADAFKIVQLPVSVIQTERRQEFVDALVTISTEYSASAAFDFLRGALTKGLETPLAAVAGHKITRATREYAQGASNLSMIYAAQPSNTYVSYFYGDALASAGLLEELRLLARQVWQECCDSPAPETTRSRWATLLLQFGMSHEAASFIDSLEESKVTKVLRNRLSSFTSGLPSTRRPVYVVSLRKDERKRHICENALTNAGYKNVTVTAGVEASTLPASAIRAVLAEPDVLGKFGYGAVGCWLSHVAVWERVAAGNDEWAVILEDDALPEFHSSALDTLIDSLEDGHPYNFVWLNERMSGKAQGIGPQHQPSPVDPWELLALWGPNRSAIGTDAYALTRNAASELLKLAHQGVYGHIDGFLAAWTIGRRDNPTNQIQNLILDFQSRFDTAPAIRSTALSIPLFKEENFGYSSR